MKKMILSAVVAMACACAFAGMDDREYNLTVVGTNVTSATYVLRGTLEAVKIDLTAPSTSTVAIASGGLTLFSKASIAADATYLPRAAAHTTAGAAATFIGGTNDTANTVYVSQPMAGEVTVTLTGQNGASVTNNTKVTLIYNK